MAFTKDPHEIHEHHVLLPDAVISAIALALFLSVRKTGLREFLPSIARREADLMDLCLVGSLVNLSAS